MYHGIYFSSAKSIKLNSGKLFYRSFMELPKSQAPLNLPFKIGNTLTYIFFSDLDSTRRQVSRHLFIGEVRTNSTFYQSMVDPIRSACKQPFIVNGSSLND